MNDRFTYQGAAPTGSGSTTLYDTTTSPLSATNMGAKRFAYSIVHSHNGTVVGEALDGSTWRSFYSEAHTASADSSRGDVYVEMYENFRFRWVNGGTTQSPFFAAMALAEERGAST